MMRPRVLYVQYGSPAAYPPLEHSARLLAEAGCEVLVLGTTQPGDPLQFDAGPRVTLDLLRMAPAGWRQKAHYARFTAWTLGRSRRFQPTWVYASDPLAAPVALALQRLSAARVIYHEHDSPDAARPVSRCMRAALSARRALARRADLCVLPSAGRATLFAAETGAPRIETVWNCPMRHEVADVRPDPPAGGLRVLYHGSIVPARLPMTLIEALADVEHVTLGIAGYETAGHPGYLAALRDRARALGLEDRVCCTGTLPSRDALLAHAAGFDVGLALMPSDTRDLNEQHMVGASNKPFDYLASGLALLVGDRPDWQATYVEPGYARSCEPASASSMAVGLAWFASHTAETRAMGERGRARILADWNYEHTFAPVLDYMAASVRTVASPVTRYASAGTDARSH